MKIGIIGAGYMSREHIRALQQIPSVSVGSIYSRTIGRAQSVAIDYDIPHVAISFQDFVLNADIDGVIIAVPELSLPEVLSEISILEVPFLIEKPVGVNFKVALELTNLLQQRSKLSYVALNRRFYSSTLFALATLENESDRSSRIISIRDQESPLRALKAGQPPEVCANWMYANSVHLIDYFRIFGRGKINDVQVLNHYNPNDPYFTSAHISFSSGDVGLYQALWNSPSPWSVEIQTKHHHLELKPLESLIITDSAGTTTPVQTDTRDKDFKPGLVLQSTEFIKALKEDPHTLPTVQDALSTMELISKIYESNDF